jgi:phosphatidylinositol glycan class K
MKFIICILLLFVLLEIEAKIQEEGEEGRHQQQHTSTWAVIVDTSTFWFNYRHIANSLSIYHLVKSLGLPDSQIILMLADDVSCNPRNIFRGEVFNDQSRNLELYGKDIQVDYRGYEVTVDNFLRVLTGRHLKGTSHNKKLDSDSASNILIFMSGHGGDEFLKFQDSEELSAQDIADAILQMDEKDRFHEIMFLVDTCEALTLFSKLDKSIKNVLCAGSSILGEKSYSHHDDYDIGVAVVDRFTHDLLEYFEHKRSASSLGTAEELFSSLTYSNLKSTVETRSTLNRDLKHVRLEDFFGSTTKAKWEPRKEMEKPSKGEELRDVLANAGNAPDGFWDFKTEALSMFPKPHS